jgi:hypothetical protein
MWDFVMDKVALGQVFSYRTSVSLSIYIPTASPQSSSLSPEASTSGRSANILTNQIKKKTLVAVCSAVP